ncbi:putative translation elongation factor 1-alpha [Cedratvirus lausannensis]|uniref:Putative translation elongation factor 1-alpha n=1 Tax=Cedratvirus lausannensis TaxID=2023205 RepID=A0A285PWZ6_9VIRU|nr:putative translation elongation factor 1-alpha [Cedratvirus lausannensis]
MGFYNIVFLGHVDSGKSSLCGTILLESGSVEVRRVEEAERDAEASADKGCFW